VAAEGIVAEIEPLPVAKSEPILCGLLKLPDASDNCTVKVLPLPKLADAVYETLTVLPLQKELPDKATLRLCACVQSVMQIAQTKSNCFFMLGIELLVNNLLY
jgi:hypothetical protein